MTGQGRSMACEAELPGHAALAMLARETRVRRGPVACEFDGKPVAEGHWRMTRDGIVVRGERGLRLAYRRGEGVTLDSPQGCDPRAEALWLDGLVYAAIAAINGLMPLHASAVAHEGRVFAFSGPAGAGKSTLAAALGREGLALFCDDTLIMDLSQPDRIVCLPGHTRLKLWPEGAALAGTAVREPIQRDHPKHYADPAGGTVSMPLPLAELIFLEPGDEPQLLPVAAGERIARLQDDHYTARLFERAGGLPRPQRFARLASIAARLPMRRLVRPFAPERFEEGVACITGHIVKGQPE